MPRKWPRIFSGSPSEMNLGRMRGEAVRAREPSPQSIQRFKPRVTQRSTRRLTAIPLTQVVETLNQYVRGWVGYFHYRNSSTVFGRVIWHLEKRLRAHLRKRHKLNSLAAGYEQFPNQRLYARHGLFKLPMTAGWKRTHA